MPTQMGILGRDFGLRLRGVRQTKRFLRDLEKYMGHNTKGFKEIAETAVKMIRDRTISGKDVNGNRFASKDNGESTNLFRTGAMLNAVTFKLKPFVIIIYVEKTERRDIIGEVHNFGMISGRRSGRFKQKRREWFGLSAKNIRTLLAERTKSLNEFIKMAERKYSKS